MHIDPNMQSMEQMMLLRDTMEPHPSALANQSDLSAVISKSFSAASVVLSTPSHGVLPQQRSNQHHTEFS